MMRALVFTLLLAVPVLGSTPLQAEQGIDEILWATAAEADVTAPQQQRLQDHYGDPTQFVKFIIRRPPALA